MICFYDLQLRSLHYDYAIICYYDLLSWSSSAIVKLWSAILWSNNYYDL